MEIIIKSNPPFIIKTFNSHFTISENLKGTNEKKYYYDELLKIEMKSGSWNWFLSIGVFLFRLFAGREIIRFIKDYDELIISFKTGKSDTKYLETGSISKLDEIVKLIQNKIA